MAQTSGKNLWVAASDGDIERVKEDCTPNDKDANSYTPLYAPSLHAAASYAHIDLLSYLLSIGGNPNLTDDDGETPLYVVESIEVAKFLIDNGADPKWKNEEGLTAAEQLEEEHPDVAAFLRSLTGEVAPTRPEGMDDEREVADGDISNGQISQLALDNYTATQTAALLQEAQRIMEECARDGVEPDERLREVVERAVRDGLAFGREAGEDEAPAPAEDDQQKRARED
ncbi:ankyrin repeat-containing protein [Cryptococcus deuterogattii 2001/935-1]|nr:ankyrin repeat-containing protein [Cryptococcus deuterogattii 2001/935-1]